MASLLNMSGRGLLEKLPYDAEIEYLESKGTQWIDTNWSQANVINSYSYDIVYQYTDDKLYTSLWGAISINPCLGYGQIYRKKSFSELWCGNNNIAPAVCSTNAVVTGLVYNDKIEINMSNEEVLRTCNSIQYTGRKSFTNGRGTETAYLFAMNNRGAADQRANIRCYSFRLFQDNIIVLDFIPVRKDGIGYMYDKVSKQLFGNQGTGNFILGPDK